MADIYVSNKEVHIRTSFTRQVDRERENSPSEGGNRPHIINSILCDYACNHGNVMRSMEKQKIILRPQPSQSI